jgi:HTH-type transcriptional regulator / antitoxin HigA
MLQPATDEAELKRWSLLVENYEESPFPIATPDPVAAIRFRLGQAGRPTADLLPYLQIKIKISEIINRKRPLSLTMIRALPDGLKISSAGLLQKSTAPTIRTRPTNLRRKAHRRNHFVAAGGKATRPSP